jgi:glutaredoxin-like protein NrdH
MSVVHIPGKNVGHIMLYALSTCGWCAKTKKLLDDLGVDYDFEYVDHLQGEEKGQAVQEIKKWNPSCSFPTLVINDETCIVGYKEDEIRGALKT